MEQAELHQKLAALQMELAVLKQKYDSLLEQVGHQHSLIQQLSEVHKSQSPGEKICYMKSDQTETDGECKTKT